MSLEQSQSTLVQWLHQNGYTNTRTLTPLTGDAGFRQYFRFATEHGSALAVFAPPQYCNNQAFVLVANALSAAQIKAPQIFNYDLANGFMCIEDFGQVLLANKLTPETMSNWYQVALTELAKLSTIAPSAEMPIFDGAFVDTELAIFSDWLVNQYLALSLTQAEQQMLTTSFNLLKENILAQPQVFMHRDYHSRNLMVLADDSLGVIDFQDAVVGPITYDAVSLLRDCYVKWPQAQVLTLFKTYTETMKKRHQIDVSWPTWQRWFDLTGLQRHLKASGIFARLLLRDNKPGYIKDIPLTLSYIVEIAGKYSELAPLSRFVAEKVLPEVEKKLT